MADLRIESLGKTFRGKPVLQDIDLEVASGTLLAILGISGSGKTTLLRLIAGFDRADRGSIIVEGVPVATPALHVPPERRRIGYVPQDGALFPHLTVAQNIGLGVARAARRDRVAQLLEQVGLAPNFAGRMPAQLSGGERQRIAIARALAPNPRMILLDEPFSALDALLRAETAAVMVRALEASQSTAILVTHDQAEAFSMGAEVAILRQGRIAQRAAPESLYRRPADLDLALFLGEGCILPGVTEPGSVSCLFGRLPVAEGGVSGTVEVLIRPEQIKLAASGAGGLAARVAGITYFGADALVRLKAADADLASRLFNHEIPPLGSDVALSVEGPVMVFPARAAPEAS
jgi:iron(III) transport system ATP-binding protein